MSVSAPRCQEAVERLLVTGPTVPPDLALCSCYRIAAQQLVRRPNAVPAKVDPGTGRLNGPLRKPQPHLLGTKPFHISLQHPQQLLARADDNHVVHIPGERSNAHIMHQPAVQYVPVNVCSELTCQVTYGKAASSGRDKYFDQLQGIPAAYLAPNFPVQQLAVHTGEVFGKVGFQNPSVRGTAQHSLHSNSGPVRTFIASARVALGQKNLVKNRLHDSVQGVLRYAIREGERAYHAGLWLQHFEAARASGAVCFIFQPVR